MTWMNVQEVIWEEPLHFAARWASQDMTLLYSGLEEEKTGRLSYLFLSPVSVVEGKSWDDFSSLDLSVLDDIAPDWVGYLGYETGSSDYAPASAVVMPVFRFIRYQHVLRFDHHTQTLTHASRDGSSLPFSQSAVQIEAPPSITNIASNFTRSSYEESVGGTIVNIHAGNFYQANITRKFFGTFSTTPDSFSIYQSLVKASPAPYSAYIRHGSSAILSASPECFLRVDSDGVITTRPIKGSARRSNDAQNDAIIRTELQYSAKNLAENLMIVDLMRNDLAKVSIPESVRVTEQSGLYSYATIHHLISTIQSQRQSNVGASDIIRACFPPGSMTGAPKKAAIDWCASQERMARGVYSGAIGWLGGTSTCDLSVVIRTLLIKDNQFEFQVGGGIVADSVPAEEWQETLTKARGILAALGLTEADLAAL